MEPSKNSGKKSKGDKAKKRSNQEQTVDDISEHGESNEEGKKKANQQPTHSIVTSILEAKGAEKKPPKMIQKPQKLLQPESSARKYLRKAKEPTSITSSEKEKKSKANELPKIIKKTGKKELRDEEEGEPPKLVIKNKKKEAKLAKVVNQSAQLKAVDARKIRKSSVTLVDTESNKNYDSFSGLQPLPIASIVSSSTTKKTINAPESVTSNKTVPLNSIISPHTSNISIADNMKHQQSAKNKVAEKNSKPAPSPIMQDKLKIEMVEEVVTERGSLDLENFSSLEKIQPINLSLKSINLHKSPDLMEKNQKIIDKKRAMLEFLYGLHGTPVRIKSAHYRLPFKRIEKESTSSSAFRLRNEQEFLKSEIDFGSKRIENFIPATTSEYFTRWLVHYNLKHMQQNERMEKVHENQNYKMHENLQKWYRSIDKKQRRRPVTAAYAFRQELGFASASSSVPMISLPSKISATINPLSPKSPLIRSLPIMPIEPSPSTPNNESGKVVHLQPTYTVSQIEMEEIINEVKFRVEILNKNVAKQGENLDIKRINVSNTLNARKREKTDKAMAAADFCVNAEVPLNHHSRLLPNSRSSIRNVKSAILSQYGGEDLVILDDGNFSQKSTVQDILENTNLLTRHRFFFVGYKF